MTNNNDYYPLCGDISDITHVISEDCWGGAADAASSLSHVTQLAISAQTEQLDGLSEPGTPLSHLLLAGIL